VTGNPSANGHTPVPPAPAERMHLVVAGHVDHGKSTIVGRLLADTHSLPDGKLEQIRALCARTSRPFEYAFLLDALKDERAQGITIDSARVFFKSPVRQYIIIDAPGHVEFLKNMISGAARAEAAFLVIDAQEGIRENSRRHGYLLGMLGIRQVAVLVNKMDLVAYDQLAFERIVREYRDFLRDVDVIPAAFVPVSGSGGDNIVAAPSAMPWYAGPTALEVLDSFQPQRSAADEPFRMPVQDVYKFTAGGDARRIVAGTVESGTLHVGDEVVFQPSGKRTRVRTIEAFNLAPQRAVSAGSATGFTLEQQVYVARGQVATRSAEREPCVGTRLAVSLFWLGKRPLLTGRPYILKLGAARVSAQLEELHRVIDAATLEVAESRDRVERHEVADGVLRLAAPIAYDNIDEFAATSRFVLLDDYEIAGGGIIRAPAGQPTADQRPPTPSLFVISALEESDCRATAEALETTLRGREVPAYLLGTRGEVGHLAAVAQYLADAGANVVLSAPRLLRQDVHQLEAALGSDRVTAFWIGPDTAIGEPGGIRVASTDPASAAREIHAHLEDR